VRGHLIRRNRRSLTLFSFGHFLCVPRDFVGTAVWAVIAYMRELGYGAKEDE
jgi:hypothetical protein